LEWNAGLQRLRAQKGLDIDNWPEEFVKRFGETPQEIKFPVNLFFSFEKQKTPFFFLP